MTEKDISSVLLADMPRVRFVAGRDWYRGPHHFEIGVYWGKRPTAKEGDLIYLRNISLRWAFHLRLERH